jgi:hypothetical protein
MGQVQKVHADHEAKVYFCGIDFTASLSSSSSLPYVSVSSRWLKKASEEIARIKK